MSKAYLHDRPTKKFKNDIYDLPTPKNSKLYQDMPQQELTEFIDKIFSTIKDHSKIANFSTDDYKLMLSEFKTWPCFYNSFNFLTLKEVIKLEQMIQDRLFSITQAHYNLIDRRTEIKSKLSSLVEREAISKFCFIILSEKLDSIVCIKKELLKSTISDFNHHISKYDSLQENNFSSLNTLTDKKLSSSNDIEGVLKSIHDRSFTSSSMDIELILDKKIKNSLTSEENLCMTNLSEPFFLGEYSNFSDGKSILAMKLSSNSIFVASANRICYRFDISTGDLISTFSGHKHPVTCLEISLNKQVYKKQLYTGSSDRTIRCYDIITTNCMCIFTFETQIMCLSLESNILFVGLSSGVMPCVNILNNKLICRTSHHKPKAISCIYSTKDTLYTGSFDATIGIYNIQSFDSNSTAESCLLIKQIKYHTGAILCIQIQGHTLFSGSVDRSVIAYDIYPEKVSNKFLGHTLPVSSLQVFSSFLITACLDKKVRIFNLESSEILQTYVGYSNQLFSMIVKNNIVYTGCKSGKLFALKIDLDYSFQCSWCECRLLFGNFDQLRIHLFEDHVNIIINDNLTVCGWNFCQELLSHLSMRDKKLHILSHIEHVPKKEIQEK